MTVDKLPPKIKKNTPLKNYTTFRIGGKAKYFFWAKTKKDLILVIKLAKQLKLPLFILGNGSNLLISDKGFNGLVVKVQNTGYEIQDIKIYAEAGTSLSQLANVSVKFGLMGLEWTIGIPGTVGGAIYGNAGAFNQSMKDIIESVEVFDIAEEKNRIFRNKDCKFGYRNSIFKHKKKLIIISAILKLRKGNKKEIQKKIKEYLDKKKKTQPLNFPSAGSIFINYFSVLIHYVVIF